MTGPGRARCKPRSAIGYRLDRAFASETDTWAGQRGTAVHDYVLPILAAATGARIEVPTEYRGIPGHADLVDGGSVTDAKSTTLANSKLWADDTSLLKPKLIQAHGYAAGLVDAGELPADCTVRILVIPVDGKFGDWWAYEEPFDRAVADEGAERLEWVRDRLEAGMPLPKDKPYAWCADWCGFFDLCRTPAEAEELAEIEDPEIKAAVIGYGEAGARYSAAEKDKKRYASLIRGLHAKAGEWKVTTTAPGEAKWELDEDAVRAEYAERGADVPEVLKPGSAPKLSVTRIKPGKAAES